MALSLRNLQVTPDFQLVFNEYLFRDKLEENQEILLHAVKNEDEDLVTQARKAIVFIVGMQNALAMIEQDGAQAALYLEQFKKEN